MAGRRLDPDDVAAWARLAATVRPIGRARPVAPMAVPVPVVAGPVRPPAPPPVRAVVARRMVAAAEATLDGGWDRRLRRGAILPDLTLDLHGHTLATAHAALEQALGDALADRLRVLLVVTGKPPRAGDGRRGLIRGQIGDWIAHSRHAGGIAAVRGAHPRHGGAGALYLILRRRRDG